tara:strand:+ start:76 stop:861 length:786 start_codon:yes stop_codon:yes gene_type:complete
MITETEAKQQNLPGSDVFTKGQLAYKDVINRDAFVVSINNEAYKMFLLSTLIGHYPTLISDQLKMKTAIENGTAHLAIQEMSQINKDRLENMNLEFFYIATGFELSFKACLLQNNYVIHNFEDKDNFKGLCKKQNKGPVHKSELFEAGGFFYDQSKKQIFLKGITANSLSFRLICNKSTYTSTLGVTDDILNIAEDYRNRRNQIHLPGGDLVDAPNLKRIGKKVMPAMIEFINTNIVDNTNKLRKKHGFGFGELKRLDYFD